MRTRILVISVFVSILLVSSAGGREWTLRLRLGNRQIEGMPIHWNESHVQLIGRDGRIWEFHPDEARDFKKMSNQFRPFSQSTMRGNLLREFGAGFGVTGTGHYLVVHPAGQGQKWAQRFEDLYRSMVHYFTARGFSLKQPRFPLVAIVLPNKQAYAKYGRREGVNVSSTLGIYVLHTNRILLYDTAGSDHDWYETAETIIHEATHQTSYNIGLTRRTAQAPGWLDEGLGTMFEAKGVWNSRQYTQLSDRINQIRLDDYRSLLGGVRKPGTLEHLVSSERFLRSYPTPGYALSWALTFYLMEKEPLKLNQFFRLSASRPPLEEYTSPKRLRDFRKVFGDNLGMLEVRVDRFMMSLP